MSAGWRLVALGAAVLMAAPSYAQSKKELAGRIVELQKAEVQGVAVNLADQSIAPLLQDIQLVMSRQPPGEKRDALARDLQADIKKYGDEVVPLLRDRALKLAPTTIGATLEEKFSEDELKQIVSALESPAFNRWRQMSGEVGQTLVQKLVADTKPTIEPKMRALQQTVAKRLGVDAAPAAAGKASGAAKK